MTQSIVVQVGQCGNQIGSRFWNLAMAEHESVKSKRSQDYALSTFFSKGQNDALKARAVLVDMEEGVVNEIMKSSLRHIFDHTQLITDVSGSGNNWATGFFDYGGKYQDKLSDTIRKSAELCDCLQCFFVLHSMGGGTGSGLGTFVTRMLMDEYPDAYRFVTAVFPSDDDDVITSPYNSVLAMNPLTDFADCVIPIENNSLIRIVESGNRFIDSSMAKPKPGSSKSEKPFDSMNNIVANLMLNLTSSSRFEGMMNVDLNEISMNLVPFPRLHYLLAAQSPSICYFEGKQKSVVQPRRLDQIFTDSFTKDFQLTDVEPKAHTYLACALLVRGNIEVSDIRRNIDRMRSKLKFVHWNREGWKVGHCSVPPRYQSHSLLNLSNNTAIQRTFDGLIDRFQRLYKRKAHLHHYSQVDGFETSLFKTSLENLKFLKNEYLELEKHSISSESVSANCDVPRLKVAE